MNNIIANIVMVFKPVGFNITGVVWESFEEKYIDKLRDEVRLDLLNGLFGKSIIHPWQIDVVQDMYKVTKSDYETALKIIAPEAPAVFSENKKMHEKATHINWAKNVVDRANYYGIGEN